MEQVVAFASIIVPFVYAFTELFKSAFNIKKNYQPLTAFIIGVALGVVAVPFTDLDIIFRVWGGAVAGLTASGLFDLYKKTKNEMKGENDD